MPPEEYLLQPPFGRAQTRASQGDVDRGRDWASPKHGHQVGPRPWWKSDTRRPGGQYSYQRGRLATSDAELVKVAADICVRDGTRPATRRESYARVAELARCLVLIDGDRLR